MSEISPQASFDRLKTNVVQSIASHFPFETNYSKRRVELSKIWVDDNLDINDLGSQAEARINGRTWGVPIKGEVSLVDKKTGAVIDRKTMTLARLPKLTSRYGYIVDGNEFQVDHLFRLKSGVYARTQNNGDIESEFNLAEGPFGNRFSIHLNRQNKQISFMKDQTHIPLYPILKAAGVADDEIEKAWGKDIFQANLPKKPGHLERDLRKFFNKTSEEGEPEPAELGGLVKHVHDVFDQTKLLPETTKITLGKPYTKVSGEVLHKATEKLLGLSRGTHDADDRDSLAFKEVASIDDFIPERIAASARGISARMRNTMDYKDSVSDVVTPDLFGKPVKEFFTKGSSVVERSDQTNPIQMLSAHRKTTLMAPGYGGIKNQNAITNEMRGINASHLGFLDPMKTPESEKTGVSVNLSLQARKNGKDIEVPVYNLATGKSEYLNAPAFHQILAVLPDQVRWSHGKPTPISKNVKVKLPGGAIEVQPWEKATYVMPSAKGMFDVTSNLIPFLASDQGNRVSFADKQMEQAISLTNREAPLVQSKSDHPGDPEHTFEKAFGAFSSHRSPTDGKVLEVNGNSIIVGDGKTKHKIHLYDQFPLNDSKGVMHSEPVVRVGDHVKKGQLVADTNYTKGGALAYGSNLRIGYIPYKGYNFEDGIVISESASKKLTSDHLHKLELDVDPEKDHVSKSKFLAHSQHKVAALGKEAIDLLDENGIIRVGSKVKPGQVLVAAVSENANQKSGLLASSYGAKAFKPYRDKSLVWDEDHVGTVVRVVKDPNGKGVKVHVRTEEPTVIGDKLSGRHGNKGIVTQILPDHEMPFTVDENGERKPLEVLLNPSGVPTRINTGQIMETAAAKIALKTGKPYIVDNFGNPHGNNQAMVEADLHKHGISDEEAVYDPADPKKVLGSVLVGPQYLMKLKHQVEKKLAVRGAGTTVDMKPLKYDAEGQPVRGGYHGGQGFGALEVYSLLAHGARNNLREMATYKSDKQDAHFWSRIQNGMEPTAPQTPFAYTKFVGLLQGLGVDVQKNGSEVQLLPMTDNRILELAGGPKGEIKNPHLTMRAKDLRPEKGGLFDHEVTGGPEGTKWGYIKLYEPMPNPIFMGQQSRGPIPALLNMGQDDVEDVVLGRKTLDGLTGGKAIQQALKKIDVEKEISGLKSRMPHLKSADLDRANRKLKYLLALKDNNLKPHEAYVLNYVPVVPPVFRPVTPTPRGDLFTSPLNGLYKNIAITNNELKTFDPKVDPESMRAPAREELWNGLKALQSIGGAVGYDADSPGGRHKLKGILGIVANDSEEQPKEGYFQSRLVKKRQDLSIRSTIIPEPKLGLDEVGLPRGAAMELYRPFVIAELVKRSFSPMDAQMEVKKADPTNPHSPAYRALEKVIEDRPLLLKRDPALHKFSVMAFRPVLHEGKAIKIHPLATGGFNADFDGDSVDLDTPIPLRIRGKHNLLTGRQLIELLNVPGGNYVTNVQDVEAHTYDGWRPVKNFSFHEAKGKKKYRVTLKNGVSFVVSEDHSLMVGRQEVKPGALSLGTELDHVRITPGTDHPSSGQYGLSVIYGNFLGDGCAEVRPPPQCGGRISIACKPEEERQYLRQLWENHLDVHTTDSKHGYFQVSDVKLARHFLEACGRYCDGKRMSEYLLSFDESGLKGLLAGYILSDGSVELTKSGSFLVRTWSRSKQLRDGMSLAATMLGLPHTLRERKAKGETNYLISFGKEAIKLLDYRCPGKKGDLIKHAQEQYRTNRKDNRRSLGDRGFEIKAIEEVEYNDRMIDIEVDDESHVFSIIGGVVLHNTMAGTVPVSREAVEEAKKMFPSRNLFSSTNFDVMYAPTQESMLGLHLLTKWGNKTGKSFKSPVELNHAVDKGEVKHDDVVKVGGKETTFGRLLVNSRLPKGFSESQDLLHDPNYVIKKGKMFDLATNIAKNHERDFAKSINDLKDLGNEHSFKAGFSFGLKDLRTLPGRDAILAKADAEAARIRKTVKDKDELYEKLVGPMGVYTRATKEIDKALEQHYKETGEKNRLMTMVYSGARGKTEQLRQMVAAPVLLQDSTNKTVMTPVRRSYAEGLDIGDYWISQHGARKGTLQRAQGTSLPGSLSKDILNTTMSMLVTSHDCGSKEGIHVDISSDRLDKDVYDRHLAVPYKLKNGQTLKAGTLITPEIISALRNSKHDKVVIRSPLKCQQAEGICAKCFGLNESGHHHAIGTNVGILAGQALGEPATQMAMDAFHSGGVAGNRGAASVDRFTRLNNLLEMPEKLKHEATIAKVSGKVTAVRKDQGRGGLEIFVDNVPHYVPREVMEDHWKPGMEVKKGQSLAHSTAPINPHHLLDVTRDIHTVQNYLTKEIHKVYEKEGVRKRNVEVVVRGMTNLARVKDPGSSNWNHGDVVSRSALEDHNRSLKKGEKPVHHEPILTGVQQGVMKGSEDWMARLNYIGLHGTIIEGAAKGWKSHLHGNHPIPGLAYGKEFGKPPPGAKKHHY